MNLNDGQVWYKLTIAKLYKKSKPAKFFSEIAENVRKNALKYSENTDTGIIMPHKKTTV